MIGEFFEKIEGVNAGVMAIGKFELDAVVSDRGPASDGHATEVPPLFTAADFDAEKIALAGGFGARRGGAEFVHRVEIIGVIGPLDGDLVSDHLDVFDAGHKIRGGTIST